MDDLTPGQKKLLLRMERMWPQFTPASRVNSRTLAILQERGLVAPDGIITKAGLRVARVALTEGE